MRHGKKGNHLGRTASHRKAMLSNMANSLIEHKRINTTLAKAKALRVYVEPLLTKSKNDTVNSRRQVFSYLQNKYTVTELFRDIAPKIADRPGGYTRIIKTGFRLGDNAEMCMIELVDFNELMLADSEGGKKTTRRSRSRGKSTGEGVVAAATDTVEASADAVEEVVDTVENVADAAEEVAQDAADTVAEVADATDAADAADDAPAADDTESTEDETQA